MSEANDKQGQAKKEPRCNKKQLARLRECSLNKDMTKWNEWRKDGQWDQRRDFKDEDIWLEGANLKFFYLEGALLSTDTTVGVHGKVHLEKANFLGSHLEGADLRFAHIECANFNSAHLKGADLSEAHLQGSFFMDADLENVKFNRANLEGAILRRGNLKVATFNNTDLKNADFLIAIVDGSTIIWRVKINRRTDFSGVGLDSARIDPGTKQLLEYNIRRMNWEEWYKGKSQKKWVQVIHKLVTFPVRLFWWMSDYGRSTGRIVGWFLGLALLFAAVYTNWEYWFPPGVVNDLFIESEMPEHISWLSCFLVYLFRPIYFSVVTMTTLGFGDMYARAWSWPGHILLMVQVILGYVLLAALVTRFAVLFTAGGPAGKFVESGKSPDAFVNRGL